jgi:hypothetical protein
LQDIKKLIMKKPIPKKLRPYTGRGGNTKKPHPKKKAISDAEDKALDEIADKVVNEWKVSTLDMPNITLRKSVTPIVIIEVPSFTNQASLDSIEKLLNGCGWGVAFIKNDNAKNINVFYSPK